MSSRLRATNLELIGETPLDVLIVGGGINGAVSAACLAARGAKVGLIEKSDFGSFTSQESSNLAWGGIKYMETMELGLVRKLCMSRNHLIRSYPSTVQEIRFFALHERGFRFPLWLLLAGAWLYWVIGNFFTRRPRRLRRATLAREEPVVDASRFDGGFEYSDAFLHDNDARFVWNFVRSALDHGCLAVNYVESMGSRREADGTWVTRAADRIAGGELQIRSRVLVNACGPFVDAMNKVSGQTTHHRHALSKGIHLLVDRISTHRRVITFFADDGRPFFVIPMGPASCIGTTDTRVDSPVTQVTEEDRRFVLENINKRLRLPRPLEEKDVIAERCGVRPLAVDAHGANADGKTDWTQLSRKHVIEVDTSARHVSIFGGKMTDCLNVGEEVARKVESLGVALPHRRVRWYGEPPEQVRDEFLHQARLMNLDGMASPQSSEPLTSRLWRRYAAGAFALLEEIRADPRMADVLIEGSEYLRCEIAQAAKREMIVKLDDFLRRRSKIALVVRRETIRAAPGLREACRLLFGDEADARLAEYFASSTVIARSPP